MNNKILPFKVRRNTWGNMHVTVDRIENIHYSAKDWRCNAFTTSTSYDNYGYGEELIDGVSCKVIGCGGNYSWKFFDDIGYDESLLPQPKNPSIKGLKTQKAGKKYTCYHCKNIINRGDMYERYTMRSAGNVGAINEVFCIGHRTELREKYFERSADDVSFNELNDAWKKGVLV